VWPLRRAEQAPEFAVEAGNLVAMALLGTGSPDDGIAAANRVLAVDPENMTALELRARARVNAAQQELALADLDALLARKPDEIRFLLLKTIPLLRLDRVEEAERVLAQVEQTGGDLKIEGIDVSLCVARASVATERGDDSDAARRQWDACVQEFPADSNVVRGAVEFYRSLGEEERAIAILEGAIDQAPDDPHFPAFLAELHGGRGDEHRAEQVLKEAAERSLSPSSWRALADHYVAVEDFISAREALEKSFGARGDSEAQEWMRFAYGVILVEAGDFAKAEEIIGGLATPPYRSLLRGRLELAREHPKLALQAFEEGIALWPDNAAARYFAGRTAERLGEFEKAISHYREAVRINPSASDAGTELGGLLLAIGQNRQAFEILSLYNERRPREPTGLRLMAQAAHRSGREEVAQDLLRNLGRLPGEAGTSLVEAAMIRAEGEGALEVSRFMESQSLDWSDPKNASALGYLVDRLLEAGAQGRASKRVGEALARHADEAAFHSLEGRVLSAGSDAVAARRSFERALELEPGRADALAGIAALEERAGNSQKAVEYYDEAAAGDRESADAEYAAAELLARHGAPKTELKRRLERLLYDHPRHASAANDLALIELEEERLDEALPHARRAVRFRMLDALETLGRVQLARGDASQAVDTLRRRLKLSPAASTQYWLGLALEKTGDKAGAGAAFRAALNDGYAEPHEARAALARVTESH
jgi:tetratricopeptide (TPR) repeat protein